MVRPVSVGAVQVTSSAGSDGKLNLVRVSVGSLAFAAPTSVTLMVRPAVAAWPCTVQCTLPV